MFNLFSCQGGGVYTEGDVLEAGHQALLLEDGCGSCQPLGCEEGALCGGAGRLELWVSCQNDTRR